MRTFGDQCAALHGTQMMHQLFANSLATMVRLQQLKLIHYICLFNAGTSLAYSNAYFGQSVSPILLTGLSCTGNETSLVSCPRSLTPIGYTGCSHTQDAGVSCSSIGLCSVHLFVSMLFISMTVLATHWVYFS